MKIRTVYFKVPDIPAAVAFWKTVLRVEPHKTFDEWHEFMVGNVRLGLLKKPDGDRFNGSGCVPVFEFPDAELPAYIERAKAAGAELILDGLEDERLKSIVFKTPEGHEFELSRFHD